MSGNDCSCSGDGIIGVMVVRVKPPYKVTPLNAALVCDVMEAACALIEDGMTTLDPRFKLEVPYDKLMRDSQN